MKAFVNFTFTNEIISNIKLSPPLSNGGFQSLPGGLSIIVYGAEALDCEAVGYINALCREAAGRACRALYTTIFCSSPPERTTHLYGSFT